MENNYHKYYNYLFLKLNIRFSFKNSYFKITMDKKYFKFKIIYNFYQNAKIVGNY